MPPLLNRTPADGSGAMFDTIAPRYDLLNRLMSFGLDGRWRRQLVRSLELEEVSKPRVLDLAAGTGDVSCTLIDHLVGAQVVALDPSEKMLEIADRKLKTSTTEQFRSVVGDAQALPFADQSFDGITIAFGIRNIPDRGLALREMARVVRPKRRVSILELVEPRGMLGPLARLYVHDIVPRLGALLSGAEAYRYLEKSIAAFPNPQEFQILLAQSGLQLIRHAPLSFGAVNLFVCSSKG